jgi:FkbM family methyltransferase
VTFTTHAGRTPKGRPVRVLCRDDTHDEATARSVLDRDEYHLAGLTIPVGLHAIDVGAYTGAVSAALVLDFHLRVVAVEPIPENGAMVVMNAALNKVAGYVDIDLRAASRDSGSVGIDYGYDGSHHYVGNLGEGEPTKHVDVEGVTLGRLLSDYRIDRVALLKIDCEGCEMAFLDDPALASVERIVGEVHGNHDAVAGVLARTHDMRFVSDYIFHAALR